LLSIKYKLIKSELKEDVMAMKWNLEADIHNKTMEETLIEVFGCAPADQGVAGIYAGNRTKLIKTDFYLAGNAMEMMLIEVFGCNSLDGNAIKLEANRARKKIKSEPYSDNYGQPVCNAAAH
jgi:hypothetical protein